MGALDPRKFIELKMPTATRLVTYDDVTGV